MQDEPPSPVLLVRTPYGKDRMTIGGAESFDILRAVQAWYVVVAQDVRGRYRSEGEFEPNVDKISDGVDMIAWTAAQPWSAGAVGTFGGSYLGGIQWLPARQNPAALKAMTPAVTFSDMHEGCYYQGGANVLHGLRWVVEDIVPAELRRRAALDPAGAPEPTALELWATLNELPLGGNPLIADAAPFTSIGSPIPSWASIGETSRRTAATSTSPRPPSTSAAGTTSSNGGTLQNFQNMRQLGGSERARRNQRVIIGPWTHTDFSGSFPDREFGPAASATAIDLTGIRLRWFDHWLRGDDNGVESEPPVMIFVVGIDQWRTETDWPLPDTHYLHSDGQADSLRGDGTLSATPPGGEPSDVYLFNPFRPVPTVGGQVILPGATSMGPRDQREVEVRDDVLVLVPA